MVTQLPSSRPTFAVAHMIREDLQALRASWFWFVALGLILIVIGVAALSYSFAAGIATVLFYGLMLAGGGLFHIAGAFFTRGWGGFFLSLLAGVLELALGVIFIEHPIDARGRLHPSAGRRLLHRGAVLDHRGRGRRVSQLGVGAPERGRYPAARRPDLAAVAVLGPVGRRHVHRGKHDL